MIGWLLGWNRTAVYTLRGYDGEVLYVGISNHPTRRFMQHADDKDWWEDVDQSRTKVRWVRSRRSALRVERRKIRRWGRGTVHNHLHNPRRGSPRPRRGMEGYRPTMRSWSVGLLLVCVALVAAYCVGLPVHPLVTLVCVAVGALIVWRGIRSIG